MPSKPKSTPGVSPSKVEEAKLDLDETSPLDEGIPDDLQVSESKDPEPSEEKRVSIFEGDGPLQSRQVRGAPSRVTLGPESDEELCAVHIMKDHEPAPSVGGYNWAQRHGAFKQGTYVQGVPRSVARVLVESKLLTIVG